jgi:hypothetical protein
MKTWRAVMGLAATAGAVAALAGCGGADTPGTATAASSATPAASSSASPAPSVTLEPPVDGALPVPAFPPSAIPWDELGDGWFLLTYDPDATDDVWPELPEDGLGEYPELDESVMLVSPTGDLYYVRSLVGTGNGSPVQWTGDALTILDGQFYRDSDDIPHGPLLSLTLASGAASIVNPFGYYPYYLRTLSNGNIVTQWGAEGSLSVEVIAPDLTVVTEVCQGDGVATSVSPDGTRVVCLENGANGKSQVTLYTIPGGAGTFLEEFKFEPWAYGTSYGWWDQNSFVLVRWNDEGDPLRWAYDVTTKELRDLNATLSDGTPAEIAQGVGEYRVVSAGDAVEIQGFDGSLRATLPCLPSAVSGHRALAVCWDWENPGLPMDVVVANLDTGTLTTVASFVAGEGSDLRVFPPPGGERSGLA